MGPAEVNNAVAWLKLFNDEFYLNRKNPEEIVAERPQLAGFLKMAAHWTYMQQLADADPSKDWNRSKTHVLIFSGTSDFIGSQEGELLQMIREANKTRSNPIRFSTVSNMDHFFRGAESQAASFKNQSILGLPLYFKESFLTDLKTQFLDL
ncbi:hypothetical protein D3C87_1426400 [compost metagenome]